MESYKRRLMGLEDPVQKCPKITLKEEIKVENPKPKRGRKKKK